MAFSEAGHYIEALIDTTGQPLVNQTFLVYELDNSTLATLYSDETKATTVQQPRTTTEDGNAEFYADVGSYYLHAGDSSIKVDVYPTPANLNTLSAACVPGVDFDFGLASIQGWRDRGVTVTGTTYTIDTTTPAGSVFSFTNSSPITVTLGACKIYESFEIVQSGSGQITFVVSGSATLVNAHSHTKTFGQRARVSLRITSANNDGSSAIWNLAGDTAA